MGPDEMIPRHVYDKPITVRFPDSSELKERFQPDRKRGLIWYADGSRQEKHWGWGVLLWDKAET
jgi:hypothetical protein